MGIIIGEITMINTNANYDLGNFTIVEPNVWWNNYLIDDH